MNDRLFCDTESDYAIKKYQSSDRNFSWDIIQSENQYINYTELNTSFYSLSEDICWQNR